MAIPTATELYDYVANIIKDASYTQSAVIAWFNECLLDVSFRVQLPLLEASAFVYTTSGVNYTSLPSNFQRDIFSVYNLTTGLNVKIFKSTDHLMKFYEGSNDMKGDVTGVSRRGSNLFYQHVPEPSGSDGTESTVTLQASTISFTEDDQGISDSGSAFVSTGFEADDRITISGSANRNDGPCNISTIEDDGSSITVDKTIRDESAGATVTISNGNILQIRFFEYPTLLTETDDTSTEQVDCLPEAMVKPLLCDYAIKEFYNQIEEDENDSKRHTIVYESKYESHVRRMQMYVGGDMKSQTGFFG
jgi:hypothetical protein